MTNKINKYLLIVLSITIFNCGGKEEKVAKDKVAIDSKVLSKKDIIAKNIANISKSEKNVKRNALKNRIEKQSPRLKKRTTKEKKEPLVNKVKAPNFYLSDLDGNIYDLSAFSGQVIMLNFWGTWCGPCRIEHPILMKLSEENNLKILGVNFKDKKELARKFLKDLGDPYSFLLRDIEGKQSVSFGIYGIPESLLINNDNIR